MEHKSGNHVPINADITSTWKAGNPKFAPYEVGQKVIKKIFKPGNLLVNKLSQKYDGPYKIISANPNRVTYEVQSIVKPSIVRKVHYEQLRLFYDVPKYLGNIMPSKLEMPGERGSDSSSDDGGLAPPEAGANDNDTSIDSVHGGQNINSPSFTKGGHLPTHNDSKSPGSQGSDQVSLWSKMKRLTYMLEQMKPPGDLSKESNMQRLEECHHMVNPQPLLTAPLIPIEQVELGSDLNIRPTNANLSGANKSPVLLEVKKLEPSPGGISHDSLGVPMSPLAGSISLGMTRQSNPSVKAEVTGDANTTPELGNSQRVDLASVYSTPIRQEEYEGFEAGDVGQLTSALRRDHLISINRRRLASEGTQGSGNYFLRRLWRPTIPAGDQPLQKTLSDEGEHNNGLASEFEPDQLLTSTPKQSRRRTRSQGGVTEYSNVQIRALEYELRAKWKANPLRL